MKEWEGEKYIIVINTALHNSLIAFNGTMSILMGALSLGTT